MQSLVNILTSALCNPEQRAQSLCTVCLSYKTEIKYGCCCKLLRGKLLCSNRKRMQSSLQLIDLSCQWILIVLTCCTGPSECYSYLIFLTVSHFHLLLTSNNHSHQKRPLTNFLLCLSFSNLLLLVIALMSGGPRYISSLKRRGLHLAFFTGS